MTTVRPASIRTTCSCTTTTTIILDGSLACARCSAPLVVTATGTAAVYSQHDGERPAGCKRIKYLRIWRRAHESGDAGATSDGRARLLTAESYARHAQPCAPRQHAPVATAPDPLDEQIARSLGLDPVAFSQERLRREQIENERRRTA